MASDERLELFLALQIKIVQISLHFVGVYDTSGRFREDTILCIDGLGAARDQHVRALLVMGAGRAALRSRQLVIAIANQLAARAARLTLIFAFATLDRAEGTLKFVVALLVTPGQALRIAAVPFFTVSAHLLAPSLAGID